MENRYVGDVGDFGKYGLLKALCLPSKVSGDYNLSLGVVWYLVPDEPGSDGRHTRYLKDSPKNLGLYRSCDPGLYDSLKDVVCGDRRNVSAIRQEEILPPDTVFFEEPLTFDVMLGIGLKERDRRLAYRSEWVRQALDQVTGCDLLVSFQVGQLLMLSSQLPFQISVFPPKLLLSLLILIGSR